MNKRVLILTVLICLAIVVACIIAGSSYYAKITVPIGSTREVIETQTAAAATSFSLSATNSVFQTQTAIPTNTPLPTPTMIPTSTATVTPPPEQTLCDAVVQGDSRALYPVPGQGHKSFDRILAVGEKVKILGRLSDNGWYKVEVSGEQGWIKSASLQVTDSCKPTIFDLHYLAGWLDPNEDLVLEDTFATNANIWVDANSQKNILPNTLQQGESVLNISSDGSIIVEPMNFQTNNVAAFKLYTSFTVDNVSEQSYFGFRFRESEGNYYELLFSPLTCQVNVTDANNLIFTKQLDLKTCIDRYYDLYISLTSDDLEVQINGFDPILVHLQNPNGELSQGKISLVLNKMTTSLDYIVITKPK